MDVYRGEIRAERNFGIYAVYISFFPKVMQGPIERGKKLLPQLHARRAFQSEQASYGLKLMAWGYFKKLILADSLSVYVNQVYNDLPAYKGFSLVLATFFFAIQLYCDFSGYTDIALGSARLLGINLTQNFKAPYFASSIKDFWGRWHISLSSWLRDYIYIPLGGNRAGRVRHALNIMITFLVSGLWHGAGWTYLVWGGLHGLCQAAENHLPPRRGGRIRHALRMAGAFGVLVGAFVIFRASSLGNAAQIFRGILCNGGHAVFSNYWELGLTSMQEQLTLYMGIACLLAVDVLHERGISLREKIAALPLPARWAVYEMAVFAFLFMGRFLGGGSFLYARF